MPDTDSPRPHMLRTADLATRRPTPFAVQPDPAGMASLCDELGLIDLRKLRFEGTLAPEGRHDWRLEAKLGATAVQPCVVTLAPVTTRIDTPVLRRFVAQSDAFAAGSETEMPEDDTLEPLGTEIDLMAVLRESLALALPDYPRADDAMLSDATAAPDGAAPITEAETRPFAALAGLRDKLTKKDG